MRNHRNNRNDLQAWPMKILAWIFWIIIIPFLAIVVFFMYAAVLIGGDSRTFKWEFDEIGRKVFDKLFELKI